MIKVKQKGKKKKREQPPKSNGNTQPLRVAEFGSRGARGSGLEGCGSEAQPTLRRYSTSDHSVGQQHKRAC